MREQKKKERVQSNVRGKKINNLDSEKKFKNIIDLLPEIIFETDAKGLITYSNDIGLKTFGYSKEEISKGINSLDVLIPEQRKQAIENMTRIMQGEDLGPSEYIALKKDGSKFPIVIHSAPIIHNNKSIGIRGVLVNLTTLKLAEQKYKRLFDASPDGIGELDEDCNTILAINSVLAKIFNKKPNEMIGKKISEFLPKSIFNDRWKIAKNSLKINKIQEFEDFRNGRFFYNMSVPIISSSGKKSIQIIVRDVTDKRKIESKYRTLFETSRDAIMMLEPPDWRFTAGNKSCLQMFLAGDEKKFTSISPWELSPKFQSDGQLSSIKAKKMINVAIRNGSNYFEWIHKRFNGDIFPATVLLTRIEIEGKKILQATVRDISERKKIEEALKKAHEGLEEKVKERTAELTKTYKQLLESERKYRTLFENSMEGIIITNQEGKIVSVNNATLDILGYKEENELIGQSSSIIYSDLNNTELMAKRLLDKGYVKNYEMKLLKKDGTIIDALGGAVLIKNKKGNIERIESMFSDITEMKSIEKEIIQTKNQLQNVIDSASQIIIAIDEDYNVLTWNKTLEKISHYKQKQLIGKNLLKMDIVDKTKKLEEYIKNIYNGNKAAIDLIIKTKFGLNKILSLNGSIIYDEKDQMGILLVGEDITEESEIHGKLLSGNSYLIDDENIKSSLDLFKGLTISKNNGLLITRDNPINIENVFPLKDVELVELTQEKIKDCVCIFDLDRLVEKIDDFISKHNNPVILFDRIDYLLVHFSFEEVMNALYKINDLMAQNNTILLLRVNSNILNKQQFVMIKEEFKTLPGKKVEDIELDDKLFDILKYVYDQNKHNIMVTYQKISREFSISKVTTGKRLNILKDKNLISIEIKGRSKSVNLSDQGNELLNRRGIL